jgi:hypothetical protein
MCVFIYMYQRCMFLLWMNTNILPYSQEPATCLYHEPDPNVTRTCFPPSTSVFSCQNTIFIHHQGDDMNTIGPSVRTRVLPNPLIINLQNFITRGTTRFSLFYALYGRRKLPPVNPAQQTMKLNSVFRLTTANYPSTSCQYSVIYRLFLPQITNDVKHGAPCRQASNFTF